MARADAALVTTLDADFSAALLPQRELGGHKGTFGTLLCVAGSLDYLGAALLTATAAARGGAGLVALAVPRSLQPLVAGRVPEVVTFGLAELQDGADVDPEHAIEQITERAADALVIGPGLRESEAYRELVVGLLGLSGAPAVVDGGALNLLATSGGWRKDVGRNCVLTPHPGEFERLTGAAVGDDEQERIDRCLQAARQFGQVVVLKGARTVVASADGRVAVAPFANPALATAGSGDVLAGLIGALLAQDVKPFEAACLGVYLHGMAGERISQRLGDSGLLASDLPYEIAVARHELARKRVD